LEVRDHQLKSAEVPVPARNREEPVAVLLVEKQQLPVALPHQNMIEVAVFTPFRADASSPEGSISWQFTIVKTEALGGGHTSPLPNK